MSLRRRLSSGDLSVSTKIKQQQKTAKKFPGMAKGWPPEAQGSMCHPMVRGFVSMVVSWYSALGNCLSAPL